MADLLRFVVLTPEKSLLDVGGVHKVRILLADGAWLSVYPGHAPLLAEMVAGPVSYVTDSGTEETALTEGIVRIDDGTVTIFTGGLIGSSSAMDIEPANDVEEVMEFDRLAQVLMVSLDAHSGAVLANESEGA